MSTVITLDDARARGLSLPDDDAVAQDIIDEQEAWLTRKLQGPLTGERTETFFVHQYTVIGKLGLRRYTDEVTVNDAGSDIASDLIRLIDNGSAFTKVYTAASQIWTGPYVLATYTPNDEVLLRKALYDLIELDLEPLTGYDSETLGDYQYSRGARSARPSPHQRAAIAAALIPKRDQLTMVSVARGVTPDDPVINRREYEPFPI